MQNEMQVGTIRHRRIPTYEKKLIMHNVRRYFKDGNIYFLTHVTYKRKPILVENVDLLWLAIEHYQSKEPLVLEAWVILPDHLHLILNPLKNDPAMLMKRIKLSFAAHYRKRIGIERGQIWHNRYWDHIIRNQNDFNRHVDYIHFNPVKHGFAAAAINYANSSFGAFVKNEIYSRDWGMKENIENETGFGE